MARIGTGILSIGGFCIKMSEFLLLLTADYACSIGVIVWFEGVWNEATIH
jgi:hypothetical protein